MKLRRARELQFELSDGRTFMLPPPSIAQITAVIELDPDADQNETPAETLTRIVAQLRIIVAGAFPVDELTLDEGREILQAVFAHVHGYDPNDMIALQRMLKKKAVADPARN